MPRRIYRKIRDRLRQAEDNLRQKETPRGRGFGSVGVKRDRNLYKNGGEFKSRF